MKSSGKRRGRGGHDSSDSSESDDPNYTVRHNAPRRSRNAYPNYRIDVQDEDNDFIRNDGAHSSTDVGSSRNGARQTQNILTFDHVEVITYTSMRNREVGDTSQPISQEAGPSSLSYRARGQGRDRGRGRGRGRGRHRGTTGKKRSQRQGRGRGQVQLRHSRNRKGLATNPILINNEEEEYESEYDDDDDDDDDDDNDGGVIGKEDDSDDDRANDADDGNAEEAQDEEKEEENPKTKGTILSWLIDMKVISENEKVHCKNTQCNRQLREGAISREGIICNCCKEIFRVSRFQVHVGDDDDASKPYEKIFISKTNISLIMCQIEAWNRQTISARTGYHHIVPPRGVEDQHDDACTICSDGGPLICCESCPSTYHPKCLLMKETPQGEWQCPNCRCKFCNGVAIDGKPLFTCFQCQQRYHCECCPKNPPIPMDSNPQNIPFCGHNCSQINRKLEEMLGQRQPIDKDLSWSLLRRMDQGSGPYNQDSYLRIKSNSKIAIAARIMGQAFESITDRHCKIDTIQSVVYSCGSNFNRVNFSRFYTAVLESKDEVISVASIRIHGHSTAEMPFIATSKGWRKRGMCRLLFTAIESALCDLGIESLIIPSTAERVDKWKNSYNFTPVTKEKRREITRMNILMFPFATRLQKVIQSTPKKGFDLNLDPPEEE